MPLVLYTYEKLFLTFKEKYRTRTYDDKALTRYWDQRRRELQETRAKYVISKDKIVPLHAVKAHTGK